MTQACVHILDLYTLDFVIVRFFMKLFKTNNLIPQDFVCQVQFGYQLPCAIIQKRTDSFLNKIKEIALRLLIMPPPHRAEALSYDARLTSDVCLTSI